MKLSALDRILLLLTSLFAAYEIVVGINNLSSIPITAYAIGFGVLLVSALLLFILGVDSLESPAVVVITTMIPLSLSTGLVWQHLASFRTFYLIFALGGFAAVILTRSIQIENKLPTFVLAIVHGISGVVIFLLPIIFSINRQMQPAFALVGVGGALMGLEGLILAFSRFQTIISKETMRRLLPWLLLTTTICFVAGFKLG
jgi:hypothetical protein